MQIQENHREQMYGLINHYKANTFVTDTQVKNINFTYCFRSPTLCFDQINLHFLVYKIT